MNNEWLNSLRSRMEDHEEDVPDGLWDDIRDELFSDEEDKSALFGWASESQHEERGKKKTGDSDSIQRTLLYRMTGIAAAIVLLIVLMKFLPGEKEHKVLAHKDAKRGDEKKSVQKAQEFPAGADFKENTNIASDYILAENRLNSNTSEKALKQISFGDTGKNGAKNNKNIPENGKTDNGSGIFAPENSESQKIASGETADNNAQEKPAEEIVREQVKELYVENTKNKKLKPHQKRSWMLSMLTGNASSNSAEQQFPGYASISGQPMNVEEVWTTSEYEDDPLTEILLANQSKPVEARIRHKIPVTFGLSLYYNLGKRWGIGTGLNYTKLASELHSGSGANYIKGDQIVHYIGIPVQVNYNVIRKGRFTGYVTGGALLEKPVSGSITTNYIVNDEVRETIKEKLDHKPLQFSVNTAVGLQLKVIDKFGIYAEPGIGYHFKGDNAPNTIYKEKPLHFNVKLGVRLLLD
ncbi:outer membrane beta-barrel protein [Chryseobacterium arthrosphaerae]|uniref:outer membrane beta-barrel protein n=1 Tax=Chryseobacterium arthrosphaerae TaxID=651561 RepID=UPI0023E0B08D|nr:outer membrane beta-barrel protein [Chryseobacterium arthrosphaerae]WES96491.1 outer membrane beta-barrel protein [Chryseobacterium arthrosphaerae]